MQALFNATPFCLDTHTYTHRNRIWLLRLDNSNANFSEFIFPLSKGLVSCLLTAVFCTIYHATLMKIFSTLDAAQAVVTFWICSLLLLKIDNIACHIGVVGVLAAIFTYSWRKTATIALVLTAVVVPSSVRSVSL